MKASTRNAWQLEQNFKINGPKWRERERKRTKNVKVTNREDRERDGSENSANIFLFLHSFTAARWAL